MGDEYNGDAVAKFAMMESIARQTGCTLADARIAVELNLTMYAAITLESMVAITEQACAYIRLAPSTP